jgi:aldehyde:ferredoxin oxidoreductase
MNKINGTSNRILEVDLSQKTACCFMVEKEEREMYLGGKGLGLKYISERMTAGTDPLGKDNYLAFMMGVLMGTGAPCSARFEAITKSPLTGIMAASSCGGPFGMAYKTAGFDGLLLTGQCDQPTFLEIDENEVRFKNAAHLWGKDTEETQTLLNLDQNSGALVIGPAGENKVLFANIRSGHRYLGRGGMGAVMGGKNLKAIVAKGGTHKISPVDRDKFKKTVKQANKYIRNNHFVGGLYKSLGTAANVNICNTGNILPVNNFKKGADKKAGEVSGEAIKEKYNTKPSSCKSCPVRCGHKGTYKDGSVHQIPEYETIGLIGTNLGIFDVDKITKWNDLCGKMGMDTISTGSTIGWAMEAGEKGILKTDLAFGKPEGVSVTITDIAHREGVGNDLADGIKRLSKKMGGTEFAIQVKGLEMAAYDPRGSWGQGLAYAVANRGACHLSATTMALEVFMGYLNPYTTRAKAVFVKFFENLFAAVNSMHTCQFAAFSYVLEPPIVKYTPKPLLGLTMQYMPKIAIRLIFIHVLTNLYSSITGLKISQKKFLEAGERVHLLERFLNTKEGISRKDDQLPQRILSEKRKSPDDRKNIPLEKMLDDYYKLRGYDEDGIPKPAILEQLGINIQEKSSANRSKPFKTTVTTN